MKNIDVTHKVENITTTVYDDDGVVMVNIAKNGENITIRIDEISSLVQCIIEAGQNYSTLNRG